MSNLSGNVPCRGHKVIQEANEGKHGALLSNEKVAEILVNPSLFSGPALRVSPSTRRRDKRERERESEREAKRDFWQQGRLRAFQTSPLYLSWSYSVYFRRVTHPSVRVLEFTVIYEYQCRRQSPRHGNCEHSPRYSANTSFHKFHLRIHVMSALKLLLINICQYCIRVSRKSVRAKYRFLYEKKKIYIIPYISHIYVIFE